MRRIDTIQDPMPALDQLPIKIEKSIMRLREFEPSEGYWLGFSGGKDSTVLLDIAFKAGVRFDAHHSLTTIDPPELVQFVKRSSVAIDKPSRSFYKAVVIHHCLPTRLRRWCCKEFKEIGGTGRFIVTGIRANESRYRNARQYVENCYNRPNTKFLHPLFEWTTTDIWRYIRNNELEYCTLYDEGWERVGCLFCPNASVRERAIHTERYPRYVKLFKRAIEEAVDFTRRHSELDVESYWRWYLTQ